MRAAREAVLFYDGVDAEVSAAAGVAWLMRRETSFAGPVLCVVTASGFKHTYRGDIARPAPSADRQAMAQRIHHHVSAHGIEVQLA
jgi:threonine synthase